MIDKQLLGQAPPIRLAIIRVITVIAALTCVLWENLPTFVEGSTAWYKPVGLAMFIPEGMMIGLLSSWWALFALKWVLVALLVCALIGFRTRLSLFMLLPLYFVFISIPRAYAWFFHFGLTSLFLMAFLFFLPCGDALTVDRKNERAIAEAKEKRVYGWGVLFIRIVVAIIYFQAGFAKLRNTGFHWIEPLNIKHHILQDNLTVMHFDFGLGLALMNMPDIIWTVIAICGLYSEVLYPVVFLHWSIRLFYPVIAMGLHTMILFFHNIFFPDLILIQLIFFDLDKVPDWLAKFKRK